MRSSYIGPVKRPMNDMRNLVSPDATEGFSYLITYLLTYFLTKYENFVGHLACRTLTLSSSLVNVSASIVDVNGVVKVTPVCVESGFERVQSAGCNN